MINRRGKAKKKKAQPCPHDANIHTGYPGELKKKKMVLVSGSSVAETFSHVVLL